MCFGGGGQPAKWKEGDARTYYDGSGRAKESDFEFRNGREVRRYQRDQKREKRKQTARFCYHHRHHQRLSER